MYGSQWKGNNFEIPDKLVMHHANWTEGIQNKIALLNIVRSKYGLRKEVIEHNQNYQDFLYEYFSEFRPEHTYPLYPPYHEGKYLDQYFIDYYRANKIESDRYLIPVDWTTCYIQNINLQLLQEKILSLDKNKKYFVVSQHDDAVKEHLPKDTLRFCAGGNSGGIPIPLICSTIPQKYRNITDKDIFCSFVGSLTHPIRDIMEDVLSKNKKYVIKTRTWSNVVGEKELEDFISTTLRSKFTLCPRGYGKNSFRMYEAMQLGSIPVYIYDEDWRAFKDEVEWDDFSVSINYKDIDKIDNILQSISEEKIIKMSNRGVEVYRQFFNLEKVCELIITKI
jgi:hypothetical protein